MITKVLPSRVTSPPPDVVEVPSSRIREPVRQAVERCIRPLAAEHAMTAPEVRWFTQESMTCYGFVLTSDRHTIWLNADVCLTQLLKTAAHEVRHLWQLVCGREPDEPAARRAGSRMGGFIAEAQRELVIKDGPDRAKTFAAAYMRAVS